MQVPKQSKPRPLSANWSHLLHLRGICVLTCHWFYWLCGSDADMQQLVTAKQEQRAEWMWVRGSVPQCFQPRFWETDSTLGQSYVCVATGPTDPKSFPSSSGEVWNDFFHFRKKCRPLGELPGFRSTFTDLLYHNINIWVQTTWTLSSPHRTGSENLTSRSSQSSFSF